MIIDYEDMVASGIIKEASDFLTDNANAVYAIYLNTPAGETGKFRITNDNDIKNSIEAINKNASLPEYIKRPAMHFISKAASDRNIDTGWDNIPDAHYSRHIDYRPPSDSKGPHYVLKIAGQHDIEIYNDTDYYAAVDMFKTAKYAFRGKERIAVAGELLKTAIALGVPCDPDITAYAYANYSPRTAEILNKRIKLAAEDTAEKYALIKTAHEKLGDDLPPDTFIDAMEEVDKEADIHRDVIQFFRQ